ncbi:MAG: hypothetical protein QF569_00410 [Candidatus Poribacteria bacterium]|nr:hypothetical protein [Candidatus Poribacteria bacterium]
MKFQDFTSEGVLIELFGDRTEQIGNAIVGGLAWFGSEKVVWAEVHENSEIIDPSSIRRLQRLLQISTQTGRATLLSGCLIDRLAHQVQQASIKRRVAIQLWVNQVVDHPTPIVIIGQRAKLGAFAKVLADGIVTNKSEAIQMIRELIQMPKEKLQLGRQQRIVSSALS